MAGRAFRRRGQPAVRTVRGHPHPPTPRPSHPPAKGRRDRAVGVRRETHLRSARQHFGRPTGGLGSTSRSPGASTAAPSPRHRVSTPPSFVSSGESGLGFRSDRARPTGASCEPPSEHKEPIRRSLRHSLSGWRSSVWRRRSALPGRLAPGSSMPSSGRGSSPSPVDSRSVDGFTRPSPALPRPERAGGSRRRERPGLCAPGRRDPRSDRAARARRAGGPHRLRH